MTRAEGEGDNNFGVSEERDFVSNALSLFDVIDKDRNGSWSLKEMNAAVTNPRFRGPAAATVAEAGSYFAKMAEHSLDGEVSRQDLRNLYSNNELLEFIATRGQEMQARRPFEKNRLYTHGVRDSIKPDSVQQGFTGSCLLLAEMSALASTEHGRRHLASLITDNLDGTYDVRLNRHGVIKVVKPTEAELELYAHSRDGLWPAILEKAVGQAVRRSLGARQLLPQEALQEGLEPEKFGLLSDGAAASVSLDEVDDSKIALFFKEVADGNMAAGLMTRVTEDSDQHHCHAVIAYDPTTQEVTLRDPIGRGVSFDTDGEDDGIYKLSLADLKRHFDLAVFADLSKIKR